MSSTAPTTGPQRSAGQMSPITAAKARAQLADLDTIKIRRDSGKDTAANCSSPQTPPARSMPKRKPALRRARHFVEEPLYLLPAHYALLQDSTFELLRGLSNLPSSVDGDPLYFDQLLGAAVNVKHAFDLGRMDVINGTIRPRNTSLCHECITTVSSVWRSGPDGPRTLCNACGLRYYKQNQRRAIEAKRRESRDTADAAASLAALGAIDIKATRKLLSNNAATSAGQRGTLPLLYKRSRGLGETGPSSAGMANVFSDDDEDEDDDDNEDVDEDDFDDDENESSAQSLCNHALSSSITLDLPRQSMSSESSAARPLVATSHTPLPDYSHYHHHANTEEHLHPVTLPSIASICNQIPPLPPPPSRLPSRQQLPPLLLHPLQFSSTPLQQQQQQQAHLMSASSTSISTLTSSSSTPLTQVASGSRVMPNMGGAAGAPTYSPQYHCPPADVNYQHHPHH
ncbi:hypothetical protein GGI20_001514 [Coemansia sp. BCRC 34301]|nr:hypothetical protein GGI20_001514 [Coemansia sp. BCRC 34301]